MINLLDRKQTAFLTGIRGYACLAVFFMHTSCGWGFYPWLIRLCDFGKYGVVVFFVLSAIVLSIYLEKYPPVSAANLRQYGINRLTRIYPLYAVAIVILWLFGGQPAFLDMYSIPARDGLDLFLHLTFLNIFDSRYKATVIGPEWTLSIEVWAYLLIPFLFLAIRKSPIILGGFLLLSTLYLSYSKWVAADFNPLIPNPNQSLLEALSWHWALEKYAFCFVAGLMVFRLLQNRLLPQFNSIHANIAAISLIIFSLVMVITNYAGKWMHEEMFTALITCLLVITLVHAGFIRKMIFENAPVIFLGKVSYSFYLLHYPVWRLVFSSVEYFDLNDTDPLTGIILVSISFVLTLSISTITYKHIECRFHKNKITNILS